MEDRGIARAFDFVIKMPEDDAYQKFRTSDPDFLTTYVHEWTHYTQFLSTSLGSFAAELERNIHLSKQLLAIRLSQVLRGHVSIPLRNILTTDNDAIRHPEVAATISTLRLLTACRQTLDASWSGQLPSFPIDLEYVREKRPLKLDPECRQLAFTAPNGILYDLRITARQMLEHAAKANELLFRRGVLDSSQINSSTLDYYGLLLYLYQEEHIGLEHQRGTSYRVLGKPRFSDPTGTVPALMLIFTCCQLSLMLYADLRRSDCPCRGPIGPS
jgi:hypothetical protein